MTRNVLIAGTLMALTQIAAAQDMSVRSLLQQGYTIVGVFPSPAGPGLFLQKGDSLIVCFVAERPGSPSVATQYCKPVQ